MYIYSFKYAKITLRSDHYFWSSFDVNGSEKTVMNKFPFTGLFSVIAGLLIHCSEAVSTLICNPVVEFCGYINDEYLCLKGNCIWKNQCRYDGDTLRMFFYSEDFQELDNIWDGDFFRLYIYPGDGQMVGTGRIMFHMARYHGKNSSYTVSPADTLNDHSVAKIHMQTVGRNPSEEILFENIYIRCSPESGTYGETLEIRDGKIQGVIQ